MRRAGRIFVWSVSIVLLSPLLGFVAIVYTFHAARVDAEAFLRNVDSIDFRHATISDVRAAMRGWREESTQSGDELWLTFTPHYPKSNSVFSYRMNSLLHGMSVVTAKFEFRNGILILKRTQVLADVHPTFHPFDGERAYALISGNTTAYQLWGRFPILHARADLRYKDYAFGSSGGCTGCLSVESADTPWVDPAIHRRITTYNFNCFEFFSRCKLPVDLLPALKDEAGNMSSDGFNYRGRSDVDHCKQSVAILAREMPNISVIRVLKVKPVHVESDDFSTRHSQKLEVKVERTIAGAFPYPYGHLVVEQMITKDERSPVCEFFTAYRPGKYLFFGDGPEETVFPGDLRSYSEASLIAMQPGIRQRPPDKAMRVPLFPSYQAPMKQ